MKRLSKEDLIRDFINIGVTHGDLIFIRSEFSAIGRVSGGGKTFISALQEVIGEEGTIVCLAFTNSSFFKKPKKEDAFHAMKKSYAGALSNALIESNNAFRSKHPTCSFVAIGKYAEFITKGHDEKSPAYDPVNRIIELNGKVCLIGCVDSSPGFTTAHLAEYDLGMHRLSIFSRLRKTYFIDVNGEYKVFRRKDPGLCSKSFYKFYSHYIVNGILRTGFVGDAYSIIASAEKCYSIEKKILSENSRFNICESNECFTCNMNRWDRIFRIPKYLYSYFLKKYLKY